MTYSFTVITDDAEVKQHPNPVLSLLLQLECQLLSQGDHSRWVIVKQLFRNLPKRQSILYISGRSVNVPTP